MLAYLCALLLSFASSPQPQLWRGTKGFIHFESDAPLEIITADSHELRGIIDPVQNTFAFSVSTNSFQGFNSALQQEHFHENYLESKKFPTASFSGKFIENIADLPKGIYEVRAKGMLNIHGQPVERILKCTFRVMDGEVLVSSEFTVPLSDHQITIPQVVHQKIAEEILVSVKIALKP